MSIKGITQTISLGDGKTIELETGKLAKQADGSVVLKMGNTMLLATVVSVKEAKDDVDFLPLTVDFREKYASTGRFPGGFLKREARPSDIEILTCRLVDRALRPLFPDDYHADTQVQISLISAEEGVLPDSLACLAASAAIAVSDIPFNGPISEVRIARSNGNWIINPTMAELETCDIDVMVAGTEKNIVMVEGEMKEVSEAEMLEAIKLAHDAIKIHCIAQNELAGKVEKAKTKREYSHEQSDEDLYKAIHAACYDRCYEIAKSGNPDKTARKEGFAAVKEDFIATPGRRGSKRGCFFNRSIFSQG